MPEEKPIVYKIAFWKKLGRIEIFNNLMPYPLYQISNVRLEKFFRTLSIETTGGKELNVQFGIGGDYKKVGEIISKLTTGRMS